MKKLFHEQHKLERHLIGRAPFEALGQIIDVLIAIAPRAEPRRRRTAELPLSWCVTPLLRLPRPAPPDLTERLHYARNHVQVDARRGVLRLPQLGVQSPLDVNLGAFEQPRHQLLCLRQAPRRAPM
jgi:hypothetical protein